jgi:hypothetical protein
LSTWFAAVWFVTSQKNGVSAKGLQEALGFGSYETAWAWLHKLRRAMVRPERELLDGVVELDQSFLGGQSKGNKGGSGDKAPVTIAVERTPRGRLGRVRLELADAPGTLDMIDFACQVVATGATIHTDGARMFTRLGDHGYVHRATPAYKADDLDAVMPGPHLVSSLLKRWTAASRYIGPAAARPYASTSSFCSTAETKVEAVIHRCSQQAGTDPHLGSSSTRLLNPPSPGDGRIRVDPSVARRSAVELRLTRLLVLPTLPPIPGQYRATRTRGTVTHYTATPGRQARQPGVSFAAVTRQRVHRFGWRRQAPETSAQPICHRRPREG